MNILVNENQNACLSGFGFSTVPERIAERLPYLRGDSSIRDADSIRFMPPELVQEELCDIGTEVDIFSLGCNGLLVRQSSALPPLHLASDGLQVLSGKPPWSEFYRAGQITMSLYQGKTPTRPSSKPIYDPHWEFLESCWSVAQDRPSASSTFRAFYDFLTSLVT